MDFNWSVFPDREVKRQRHERKNQAEEGLIVKISDDIMPLTDGNNTNPPTYEPGEYNGSDDNYVDDKDDIVPTTGSETEEIMLAIPPYNWHAFRCSLAKDITEPSTEKEKAAWDQDLMPVRKIFGNFEDPHGCYRILFCRKLSSDKEVDATFKSEKKILFRIARKARPDNLSSIPDKENVAKLKEKY